MLPSQHAVSQALSAFSQRLMAASQVTGSTCPCRPMRLASPCRNRNASYAAKGKAYLRHRDGRRLRAPPPAGLFACGDGRPRGRAVTRRATPQRHGTEPEALLPQPGLRCRGRVREDTLPLAGPLARAARRNVGEDVMPKKPARQHSRARGCTVPTASGSASADNRAVSYGIPLLAERRHFSKERVRRERHGPLPKHGPRKSANGRIVADDIKREAAPRNGGEAHG
mmetsp:Transcript_99956/g.311431  ORF Transcript_99956/g.311431 Transcript_99956/m.311431 type:complete len:226 (+) Transcript_99956:138-815(+)